MRVFDFSFDAPEENLALDEVLLERAETGEGGERLRFWESPVPFVVLGLTQAVDEHVIAEACGADGVSVQRRCTAGGCVLQAPGCLNYAFVLRMDREGCDTIHGSYRVILEWIAEALKALGISASPAGTSDLAVETFKVSGNSQKRKRQFFLHHGTLLFAFDASLCARYLKQPLEQPAYRKQRGHTHFLRNLDATRAELVMSVSSVLGADSIEGPRMPETAAAVELARLKYSRVEWIHRR